MLTASDIMTAPVVSIAPNALIEHALEQMLQHDVSGLPVVEDGDRLVGVISEFDTLMLLDPRQDESSPVAPVAHFMSTDVLTIDADAPVSEVASVFLRHPVRRLPVLRDGRLVGIVSRGDMVAIVRDHRRIMDSLPWFDAVAPLAGGAESHENHSMTPKT
jgi:CBS domain-containing protein